MGSVLFVLISGCRRFESTMILSYRIGLGPLYNYFFLSGGREVHQHELYSFFFYASRISLPPCIRVEARKSVVSALARSVSCLHLDFRLYIPDPVGVGRL